MNKKFVLPIVSILILVLTACTPGSDEMVALTRQAYGDPALEATEPPERENPNPDPSDKIPVVRATPTPKPIPPYPAPPTWTPYPTPTPPPAYP